MATADQGIINSSNNILYDVASTQAHQFRVNNTIELDIDETAIEAPNAEFRVVTMPIIQFTTPADNDVVTYNATTDEFELQPGGGGGEFTAAWTANHNQGGSGFESRAARE